MTELLDQIKKTHHVTTDAALARLLRVTPTAVRDYRKGRAHFGPETALRVAELLDLPPEKISAAMMAARSPNEETKKRWVKAAAAVVLVGISEAAKTIAAVSICILC
ncbi:MAG: helix-turn-helix domain-containing protein [Gammaproteobacteria bacterium]